MSHESRLRAVTTHQGLALEGLKNYLSNKEANVNKLRKYAEIFQVKTIMMPYLKALVRQ